MPYSANLGLVINSYPLFMTNIWWRRKFFSILFWFISIIL